MRYGVGVLSLHHWVLPGIVSCSTPHSKLITPHSLLSTPRSPILTRFFRILSSYKAPAQPIVFLPRLAVPLGSSSMADVFLRVNTCIRLIYTFGILFIKLCIFLHYSHFPYMNINFGYSYIPALYSHFCAYASELSGFSAHYWQYP